MKGKDSKIRGDLQYAKFCLYGFLKNLRFFEPFIFLFFIGKGLSYTEIGILYAVREISINILEIPTGLVSDVLGRRRTMVISFLSYILSFLVFSFSPTPILYYPAMLLFSLGEASRTGTHKAMIFAHLEIKGMASEKIRYYGATRAWSQRGSAASALIAAGLVFRAGNYDGVFLWSVPFYLAGLFLMVSYPKELEGSGEESERPALGSTITTAVESIRRPELARAMANISAFSGLFRASKDYLQPVIRTFAVAALASAPAGLTGERGSALAVGGVYFLIYVISAEVSRRSDALSNMLGLRPASALDLTLILGIISVILSGLTFTLGHSFIAAILLLAVFALENARKPIGTAYVAEISEERSLATILSVQSQARSLAAAALAVIIGAVSDRIGLGPALLAGGGVILLVSPALVSNHDPPGKGRRRRGGSACLPTGRRTAPGHFRTCLSRLLLTLLLYRQMMVR